MMPDWQQRITGDPSRSTGLDFIRLLVGPDGRYQRMRDLGIAANARTTSRVSMSSRVGDRVPL